jgi:methylated-DNA-[protein]-cysteine S-methyltransferase
VPTAPQKLSYPASTITDVFVIDSPIGPLGVETVGETVVGVRFGARPLPPPQQSPAEQSGARDLAARPSVAQELGAEHLAVRELTAYFAGELTDFVLPVEMRGGSEFERAVWGEIAKIPYGEMVTYGSIAIALGDPGAARAVGTACNHNPVPVIVPCHRVVGAGGKMVGFGGGIERKRKLLELEARVSLTRSWS